MGSDNLFKKRRPKTRKTLARRQPTRSVRQKILIVCEGEKTEPNYFRGLANSLRLSNELVRIEGDCGSSPSAVFSHAKKIFDEEAKKGDPFDKVHCVFDKDQHSTYSNTVEQVHRQSPPDTFFPSTSVPCFEYWVLLHFTYTTRAYVATTRQSASQLLIKELKRHLPDYDKKSKDLFASLKPYTQTALCNAMNANLAAKNSGTDNPTTSIGDLVHLLQNL